MRVPLSTRQRSRVFTRRVGTRGEITIPLAVRQRLGIRPGTKLVFKVIGEDFVAVVRDREDQEEDVA